MEPQPVPAPPCPLRGHFHVQIAAKSKRLRPSFRRHQRRLGTRDMKESGVSPMAAPKDLVTTAALVHLVQLLTAEMVAGEHRDDIDRLVRAMTKKSMQHRCRGAS